MSAIEFLDKWNIDAVILLMVFLSGLFQEKYLGIVSLVKDPRLDSSLKTLLVSFVAGSVYIVLVYWDSKELPYVKYFISYFTATSIYDLAIRPIRKWITKMTNKYFPSDDEPKPEA